MSGELKLDMETEKQQADGNVSEIALAGQLSKVDIRAEKEKTGGLVITPFNEQCLKNASYDITPTCIAMSVKTGMLEKVYKQSDYCTDKYYFRVHPKDTVLVVSNEYIEIPQNMAGSVTSRVSMVVKGFGHISTTIDPNWRGAVLIGLSNPTNKILKVYLNDENKPNQLATVSLYYLNQSCGTVEIEGSHVGMRMDLLKQVGYSSRKGFRTWWRKVFYRRRRKFTDYFFSAAGEKYRNVTAESWESFTDEFTKLKKQVAAPVPSFSEREGFLPEAPKKSKKSQKMAADYVITEHFTIRILHFIQKYKVPILIVLFVLLSVLYRFNLIPEWIKEIFRQVAVWVLGIK